MKLKVEGTPTISDWIASELSQNEDECREVGLDGMVNSYNDTMALISDLRKAGESLCAPTSIPWNKFG